MNNLKPHFYFDDGSLSIEFISKEGRIGVHFEADLKESSINFVNKDLMLSSEIPLEYIRILHIHLGDLLLKT